MVRTILAALVTISLVSMANARVGETVEECEERYGKGSETSLALSAALAEGEATDWTAKDFSARGLSIQVVFEKDRAVFVKYTNEAVFKLGDGAAPLVELTADEIQFLKKVNQPDGETWKSYTEEVLQSVAPTLKIWTTSNKARYGGYDRARKEFFVCTSTFWKVVVDQIRGRFEAGKSGKAEARLEGL